MTDKESKLTALELRIRFTCSFCRTQLSIPKELAGIEGPCPSCSSLIRAPERFSDFVEKSQENQPPSLLESLEPIPEKISTNRRIAKWMCGLITVSSLMAGVWFSFHSDTPPARDDGSSLLNLQQPIGTIVELKNQQIMPETREVESVPSPPKLMDVAVTPRSPKSAEETLLEFLMADDIGQRAGFLKSRRSHTELSQSILNKRFPMLKNLTLNFRERSNHSQVERHFFHVDFVNDQGKTDLQMLLVEVGRNQEAKVLVDPLIDLMGGEFAKFAEFPAEGEKVFQVVISAAAYCKDAIPNPEGKHTLWVLARDDSPAIGKAFFKLSSSISELLEDELSGLGYGQAKPCKVLLRWNKMEDPMSIYLEALEIKELGWSL